MRTLVSKSSQNFKQAGMASILVTMVLMVVMSLIVLGFAQVSRRNQRAALDSQLSKQAYYAAETGVNDYAKVIRSYLSSNPNITDLTSLTKSSCAKPSSGIYSGVGSNLINSTTNLQYTCVLVSPIPTSLNYSSINSASHIIPINSASIVNGVTLPINNLSLTWQSLTGSASPTTNCPTSSSSSQFPAASNWTCGYGILRIDLVTTSGAVSLASLQANTMTAYFVPTTDGQSTVNYSGSTTNQYGSLAAQGLVVPAKCTNAQCSMTINGLNSTNYYLRVSSVYKDSAIQVAGINLANAASPVALVGAQVLIDSTGKNQDVLRRVQVRIPINGTAGSSTFDAAIQTSQSICKQFETAPTLASDSASGNYYKNSAGC